MNIEKLVLSPEECNKAFEVAHLSPYASPYQERAVALRAQIRHLLEREIFAEWVKQPEVQKLLKENGWVKLCNDEVIVHKSRLSFPVH